MNLFRFIDLRRGPTCPCRCCAACSGSQGAATTIVRLAKKSTVYVKSREDDALTEKIREVHERSRQTYGSPRVHAELRTLGIRCGRKRVERLMRKAGLRGCMSGKRKGTASRANRAVPAEDLVKRNFRATEADKVWLADITYVATGEGFLYVAFILDAHSRRIVGWAMESHLRTELVVDAKGSGRWA